MTKAESAASRTPRTDAFIKELEGRLGAFATSGGISQFARTLELEAADLRERVSALESMNENMAATNIGLADELSDLRERLAKARAEAIEECARVLQKRADALVHENCVQDMGTGAWEGGKAEIHAAVEALDDAQDALRALAHPKGEDHGNG